MAVITNLNDVMLLWNGPQIEDQVRRNVGAGVRAAAIFLTARIKELISVPAPRVNVSARGHRPRYVAAVPYSTVRRTGIWPRRGRAFVVRGRLYVTVPATPHAPPRKLSGALRRSVTWQAMDSWNLVARVGTNIDYGSALEFNRAGRMRTEHAFVWPTVLAHMANLQRIIGQASVTGSP